MAPVPDLARERDPGLVGARRCERHRSRGQRAHARAQRSRGRDRPEPRDAWSRRRLGSHSRRGRPRRVRPRAGRATAVPRRGVRLRDVHVSPSLCGRPSCDDEGARPRPPAGRRDREPRVPRAGRLAGTRRVVGVYARRASTRGRDREPRVVPNGSLPRSRASRASTSDIRCRCRSGGGRTRGLAGSGRGCSRWEPRS